MGGFVATASAGNYLRVRGEYVHEKVHDAAHVELPPRARRILESGRGHDRTPGTTSACAENTFVTALHCGQAGNYLRVRGEYLIFQRKSF